MLKKVNKNNKTIKITNKTAVIIFFFSYPYKLYRSLSIRIIRKIKISKILNKQKLFFANKFLFITVLDFRRKKHK